MAGITDMRGVARLWRLLCGALALAPFGASGCADVTKDPETGMQIAVRPLALEPVLRVCYDLVVQNSVGDVLWQAGDPNVSSPTDTQTLCSDVWGTGSGGDIQYIGSCDSASNPNVVSLVIDGIYTIDGRLVDGVDWLPTCTAAEPCRQYVNCIASDNVLVNFDVVVMRNANQGFFDIAVTFDDIFCSAKVDCSYDAEGNQPIMAVHHDGQPVQSAILGVACTGGPDTAQEDLTTVLQMNDIRIACDGGAGNVQEYAIWSCNPDGSQFHAFQTTYDPVAGVGAIQGVIIERQPDSSYATTPFAPTGMGPWDYAILQRVFGDAPNGNEDGVAILLEDDGLAPPAGNGQFDALTIATVNRVGGQWQVTSIQDPGAETILLPQGSDESHVLLVNGFEGIGAPDGRVYITPIVGAPGNRTLDAGSTVIHQVPAGLTECRHFMMRDGWVAASCRREGVGPDGNTYPEFDAVVWVFERDNPGPFAVLAAEHGAGAFRASEVQLEALRRDDGILRIFVNTRFQWTVQPPYPATDPWYSGDWSTDSNLLVTSWVCPVGDLANCATSGDGLPIAEFRKHNEILPGTDNGAAGMAGQFVYGRFAMNIGAGDESLPVVVEFAGANDAKRWYDFRDPDDAGAPAEAVNIVGMFPDNRIIYGTYGPFGPSVLDGTGWFQSNAFWAVVPTGDNDPVFLTRLPAPPSTDIELREILGRAGREDAGTIITRWAGDGNTGTVIEALGRYVFRPDFSALADLSFSLPSTLIDLDPANDTAWDFDSVRENYVRHGFYEDALQDWAFPTCVQPFGAVEGPAGDAPIITDFVLDQMNAYDWQGGYGLPIDGGYLAVSASLPNGYYMPSYTIVDPSTAQGNFWHYGDPVTGLAPNPRPPEADPILLNYGVYRGTETLNCGGFPCNKAYWNVAIGFDPNVPNCTLYADVTAASNDRLVNGWLPTTAHWAWLQATIPLTGPGGADNVLCTQHPMGSSAFPATAIDMSEPDTQACYGWNGTLLSEHPECTIPEYWLRYREWNNAGP